MRPNINALQEYKYFVTYGIYVKQPGKAFWTPKQPFQLHIYGYLRMGNTQVDGTFLPTMMNPQQCKI